MDKIMKNVIWKETDCGRLEEVWKRYGVSYRSAVGGGSGPEEIRK
jgi:hypothetical protein